MNRFIHHSNLRWSQINRESVSTSLAPLLMVAITLIAYWPGLNGIFVLDDFHVLARLSEYGGVTNTHSLLNFIFNDKSGITGRPVSMLSFLINDQYWPTNPWFFKYTNLFIHVACGLSIWLLLYKLCLVLKQQNNTSLFIASLSATIWLLHPLNVSTTLYVVQRMTQLMTLFMIIGLLFFVHGRTITATSPSRGIIYVSLSLIPFGLLSLLSKENGALILFYILVLEFTLFSHLHRPRHFNMWLVAAIGIPIAVIVGYFIINWSALGNGFQFRDYTRYERLLTETRILVTYISYIFFPRASGTGLFHDDIIVSTGLFSPFTTFLATSFIISSIVVAFLFRKKYTVLSFSVLWFYAGHLLESTFLNLELYYEHRNYLPMIGFIFAFCYYTTIGIAKITNVTYKYYVYLFAPILILFLFSQTYTLANIWSNPAYMFPTWAHEHPDSLRSQILYARYLAINGEPRMAIKLLDQTSQNFPHDITTILTSVIIACEYNVPSHIKFDYVIKRIQTSRYTGGILKNIEELTSLHFQKRCPTLNSPRIHMLLDELTKVDSIAAKGRIMSRVLFQHANIYAKEGNLSKTMALLDQAYKNSSVVSIPLYQAWLLGSAGLYKDALKYLNIAEKTDAKRKFFAPSRKREISKLKQRYLQNTR